MAKKIIAGIILCAVIAVCSLSAESRGNQQGNSDYRSGNLTTRDDYNDRQAELAKEKAKQQAAAAEAAAKQQAAAEKAAEERARQEAAAAEEKRRNQEILDRSYIYSDSNGNSAIITTPKY